MQAREPSAENKISRIDREIVNFFLSRIAQTFSGEGPTVGDTLCASNARKMGDIAHG
jgi:hypothetical protein